MDEKAIGGAQNPRGGIDPVRIEAASSDSETVILDNTSAVIDTVANLSWTSSSTGQPRIGFRTLRMGAADLVLSTSAPFSFTPSDRVRVRATGPAISLYVPPISRDFVDRVAVYFNPKPLAPVEITLGTSDASKIRITDSPLSPGTAVSVFTCAEYCNDRYIEALDGSGPVSITASAPGLDPVTVPVGILDPVVLFYDRSSYLSSPYAQPGVGFAFSFLFAAGPPPNLNSIPQIPLLRVAAPPMDVRLATADPNIASVDYPTVRIEPGSRLASAGTLTPRVTGETVLSAVVSGARSAPVAQSVRLQVGPPSFYVESATVGRNLQARIVVGLPPADPKRNVTVTSSDPSRVVLSLDPAEPGSASVAVSTQFGFGLYAQALADSGDVELIASIPGVGDTRSRIHLAPSGVAWDSDAVTYTTADKPGGYETSRPSLFFYALEPITLTAAVAQAPRPGLGDLLLQIGDPAVVSLPAASVPIGPKVNGGQPETAIPIDLSPGTPGQTRIDIRQPAGFVAPTGRGPLKVTITRPVFNLSAISVARNTHGQVDIRFPKPVADLKSLPPITVTSADPSRLLVSATANDRGAASATVKPPFDGFPPSGAPYQPFYVQAIGEPADVQLTATLPGYEDATAAIEIVPTALGFRNYSGAVGTVRTSLQSPSAALDVGLFRQQYGQWQPAGELWPGFPTTPLTITNSNPAVAVFEKEPVLNARTSTLNLTLKYLSSGTTELAITPPPGFVALPDNAGGKVTVVIEAPPLTMPDVTVGRDLLAAVALSFGSFASHSTTDVDIVLTSRDPTRVLLGATPAAPGAASVTIHASPNQSPYVYVHALDDRGSVVVDVTSPGYRDTSATVTLSPTTFLASPSGSLSFTPQQSSTLRFIPAPAAGSRGVVDYQFRPGLTPFTAAAVSASPSILSVSPSQVTVLPGAQRLEFNVQPLAAGETTVALTVPAPYVAPAPVPVSVRGGSLIFYGDLTLGKDLQAAFTLTRTSATISSSDPARLLVSAAPDTVGQRSVTVSGGIVYAQALSDTGVVTVTASSPGFETATVNVRLAPALVVFNAGASSTSLSTSSAPLQLQVLLTASSGNQQARRAGAETLTVPVTLSDPNVGSISPTELAFKPGSSAATLTFTPRAAGSELITLAIPPGFADPLGSRQFLLTVTALRLALSGTLSVGKDLQAPLSDSLSGAASQPVGVTLAAPDPTRLELGPQRTPSLGPSIALDFTAGSTSSIPFYIAGLAASGSAALNASGGGLPPTTYSVSLQPSGFRFSTTSATVAAGSSTTVQVVSSMLAPSSLTPVTDLALRSDFPSAVPLTITSSNSAVVSIPSAPLYFYPGDNQQRLTISGKSSGVATLTITPPEGWSVPAGANKITVIVP